ncbi:MAG: DUF47 domain-containing protein [Acidothermaceae bacterium]
MRRVVDDLLGRSDQHLVALVTDQIGSAVAGANLARTMVVGDVSPAEARASMSEVEHHGDQQRAKLVAALSASLTTPIDREDLFRMSRFVDDVLDELRDFVRESDLYELPDQRSVAPVLDALIQGLNALQAALRQTVMRTSAAGVSTLAAKKAGGRVRQLYQLELAELFRRPLDVELMKRRELLRRIDVVGIRLGEAADALADGIMKRSR